MSKKHSVKRINLALQGGGSHGAFTWGVLDFLLEDERIEIEAVSGTSAGAMNAVVVADGLMRGGAGAARAGLELFWQAISKGAQQSPIQRNPIDIFMGNWSLDQSPGYHLMDAMSRMLSPYQLNPLNLNPLKDVLESVVDFDLVRSCDKMKVYVSATNVETGRVKVFDRPELTSDMVMASACLPMLYKAVEIDGVPYWDGGYMGNPVLFPFFSKSEACDIVVIQINPIVREGAPTTVQGIMNRMNEITFNGSLLKELRAIDFVARLVDSGALSADSHRKMFVHIIENQDVLNPLGASSKMNAEWDFLTHLRDLGRETAARWLDASVESIGERSTVDLRAMFHGIGFEHQG
jgi:NTE family protein